MDSKKDITVSKKIAGDQNGDSTIFGGVLNRHASRIFDMTQSPQESLRFASLDLIGHLLRQGQINPNETVPYLLALQGDVNDDRIRSLALGLLMKEGERRPDTLRQKVCEGVKRAYTFQRSVYPDKPEVSALVQVTRNSSIQVECVFGSVFKECIMSSLKQRHGLFRNLLGLFDIQDRKSRFENSSRKSNNREEALDLPLLSFASQVLAHLPYSVASDPLYIIHNISSTVALQGGGLLDRLSAFLRPYGLSSSDEFDESNAGEDDLERAAKRQTPHHAKEATPLLQPEFDVKGFADLCGEAAAITLLLRLKKFLRNSFNLSEARILGYDPEAKERVAEKVISKAFMCAFDSTLPLKSLSDNLNEIDMDALIHQYSEYRRLMREESHSSDGAMSDYEEEEAPSRNKRSRSESDVDE
jgi:cohesin loading factor subunit SCC2